MTEDDELQLAKDTLFELEEYDYSEIEDETLIAILHTIKKVKKEMIEELKSYLEYKEITQGVADGFEHWLKEKK
jgi:hypothetical protein